MENKKINNDMLDIAWQQCRFCIYRFCKKAMERFRVWVNDEVWLLYVNICNKIADERR